MKVDVIVVGAGIVGLFTAYELAKKGLVVTVVEKEPRPGMGVSARHANVIHVVQLPFSSLKSRLCLEGNRLYSKYSEELGFKLKRTVAFLAATGPSARLKALLAARYLRWKLPAWVGVTVVPGRHVRDAEPAASDRIAWAVRVGGYGIVDAREVVDSLVRGLKRLGGEILVSAEAVAASLTGDSVKVETSGGVTLEARGMVNAAGLYSDRVAAWFGDHFKIIPAKGVMTLHESPKMKNILTHIALKPSRETKGGGIIPQLDGRTLLGPSYAEALSREDYSYNTADVEMLVAKFSPLLSPPPSKPVEVVVGLRPTTPGRDFIISRSHRSPRVVHLVGIESPGLTAAPAIARRVMEIIRKVV